MHSDLPAAPTSKGMKWAGRILSALVVAMLLMSAGMKFAQPPGMAEQVAKFGYPDNSMFRIGIVEVVCTILYAIPQTAVLGAILLTGYLGGATATHVRIADPYFMPIVIGVVLWIGLWLRDSRVRALAPFRSGRG